MKFIDEFLTRSHQELGFLKDYFYKDFQDIEGIEFQEDLRDNKNCLITAQDNWTRVELGSKWSGRDKYFWLHFKLQVPKLENLEHYVLHMNLGRTGGGNNSGFEGQVYLDGVIRQAIDSNHEDMYLDSSFSNREIDLYIQLWSGLEGGGVPKIQHYTLNSLCAGIINQSVVDVFDYLNNMVGVIEELDEDEPLRYSYINVVKKIWTYFHWSTLTTENISEPAIKALTDIHTFIKKYEGEKKDYQITAIGHTHIDVAWLWRLKHTREKVTRSFSTVLELMKEYPEYVFFQSTPQDYEFVKEDHPEIFEQIKERIAEGRWEANGATWLEPDTNMPSGESLVRQFLYGSGYFKKNFNAHQNVLWLPDVFGYSAALPQIMKSFGVNNFMTTKISWNDTNRMPHDTFFWEGIDGSKVLTHFITTVEPDADFRNPKEWQYTYNGQVTPKTILGSYHVYADKLINSDLLLSFGFGDGGGGPTREEIKNVHILNELPGLPGVIAGRVDEYFDRLDKKVEAATEPLATWQGELYLEFHRGTYTSQAKTKNWNRRAEFALRDLEILLATSSVQKGTVYPIDKIRELWQVILTHQFHDILPGSSIHEVYDDAKKNYAGVFETIKKIREDVVGRDITSEDEEINVRNSLAWDRTEWLPLSQGLAAFEKEEELPSVHTKNASFVKVTIPALSSKVIKLTHKAVIATKTFAKINGKTIETPFYILNVKANGQLTSLFDKRTQTELLDRELGGNVISIYEDRPIEYDNWNIDSDYTSKKVDILANEVEISENNEAFVELKVSYAFGKSTLIQNIRLFSDSPRIDFITHVNWQERQRLLRTAFHTTIMTNNARFDIQYGNVLRSTNDNTSWDQAKFETVAHKWADLSDHSHGLALLNNNKYGYRVKGKELSLTLLKAGIHPDYAADLGEHDFIYSLLPHEGDFIEGDVEQIATELNEPLRLSTKPNNEALSSLFAINGEIPIALDALKITEDGKDLLIRLHDYTGAISKVSISPKVIFKSVKRARLNEEIEEGAIELLQEKIEFSLKPYEVVTLRCCF